MTNLKLSKYLNYLDYDCTDEINEPAITYPFIGPLSKTRPLPNFYK